MLFKEVIGQKHLKQQLIRSVTSNHISHSQLFLGNAGSGTLALAMAYAQYILCANRTDEDSCGVCPSCVKLQKLVHPDVHFVYPFANINNVTNPICELFIEQWRKKLSIGPYFTLNQWYDSLELENKQGHIFQGESREILRKLSFKTYEGEYKIMLIWMAETMNVVAANKLLKILEEPPEKTLFLLITESTEEMLPTILSRSQILRIPPIEAESMAQALAERYTLDESNLKNLVHISGGNFIRAMEHIKASDDNKFNYESFGNMMRLCYKWDMSGMMEWVESMVSIGREKQKGFLEYALRMVRDNFMMTLNLNELVFLSDSESEFSKKFHPFINERNIIQISAELNKAYNQVGMNAYAKLTFFDLGLRLASVLKK